MALISSSNATIATGSAGSWFTPAGTVFSADVDNGAQVILETRRGSTDGAPKPAYFAEPATSSPVLTGPCSVNVQSIAGRDYRFRCIAGPAIVAAFE